MIDGRNIFCIEGNWNRHPRNSQSIKPTLELLNNSTYHTKYIYQRCNTKDEFLNALQKFTQKRYSNYSVLYIAFHGKKNRICIKDEYITLKEIANVLEGKLEGRIVHFGSCSTLGTTESNISDFITRTKCSILSGYRTSIDYIDSTALDMCYFSTLQYCKSAHRIKSTLIKNYSTLLDNLSFIIR